MLRMTIPFADKVFIIQKLHVLHFQRNYISKFTNPILLEILLQDVQNKEQQDKKGTLGLLNILYAVLRKKKKSSLGKGCIMLVLSSLMIAYEYHPTRFYTILECVYAMRKHIKTVLHLPTEAWIKFILLKPFWTRLSRFCFYYYKQQQSKKQVQSNRFDAGMLASSTLYIVTLLSYLSLPICSQFIKAFEYQIVYYFIYVLGTPDLPVPDVDAIEPTIERILT